MRALAVGGKSLLEGCSSVASASSCAATMVPFPCALPCAGTGLPPPRPFSSPALQALLG